MVSGLWSAWEGRVEKKASLIRCPSRKTRKGDLKRVIEAAGTVGGRNTWNAGRIMNEASVGGAEENRRNGIRGTESCPW